MQSQRSRSSRSGAALLEVIVALTILTTAAASVVAFANNAARTVRHARETEAELRRASALLDAVALWPREDLDRHLGERAEGPWRLHIMRTTTTLYLVVITDSASAHELLRTAVYKPEQNASSIVTR